MIDVLLEWWPFLLYAAGWIAVGYVVARMMWHDLTGHRSGDGDDLFLALWFGCFFGMIWPVTLIGLIVMWVSRALTGLRDWAEIGDRWFGGRK